MGNLLSTNKTKRMDNIYEHFVNQPSTNNINVVEHINVVEQVQQLSEQIRLLGDEVRILKKDLDSRTSRMDTTIQFKYNELSTAITYYNEKNNEKIGIITKDMENLLNNDKILLDKLIEKNIVSTIQEHA